MGWIVGENEGWVKGPRAEVSGSDLGLFQQAAIVFDTHQTADFATHLTTAGFIAVHFFSFSSVSKDSLTKRAWLQTGYLLSVHGRSV